MFFDDDGDILDFDGFQVEDASIMIDKDTEEMETGCLESKIELGGPGMYTESPRSPAERFLTKPKNR